MILKKIDLKKISKKDVTKEYVKWMNDAEVLQFTEQKYLKHSKKDIQNFLIKVNRNKLSKIFGVFYDQELLGTVKIDRINFLHKTADISYLIGKKKYWNKGIGTYVIKKICEIAFRNLKLKKIIAGTYSNAKGSQEVLKKNGFKLEGNLKNQIQFKKNRINLLIYGLEIKTFKRN